MDSSPHRGPVGEPGGGSFTGTLERKKKNAYLGSFFLGPEKIKSCLEAIWNFSKEQGSPELISEIMGVKRGPFIRPRCIGTLRARTQMLINHSKLVPPCDACLMFGGKFVEEWWEWDRSKYGLSLNQMKWRIQNTCIDTYFQIDLHML